jgi:cation diffusion facilitator CzcD-associated flavoprotein CzcO
MTVEPVGVYETLIIGAGFSGIGMAKTLVQRGQLDFMILEESDAFGGTWHLNQYPGCACDIPTELYSYPDEPWSWSQLYSSWDEIREYLQHVARKYSLSTHTRFGESVEVASWDDDEQRWHVITTTGNHYVAQFVVAGVGALNVPQIPRFDGAFNFEGPMFHSARWDHDVDLTDKRVAVIGTGASAIQLVPEIVDQVAELHLYQRTPPWVIPNFNPRYSRWFKWALDHVPFARRTLRWIVFWVQEMLGVGMVHAPGILNMLERTARWNIDRSIENPDLRARLTPNWKLACKRLLKSNGYYPAIDNPKTKLIDRSVGDIERFTENGIVAGGVEREVDVVIYATGFYVANPNVLPTIVGNDGIVLNERWDRESMLAHRGVMVADAPNAFFMLGPNTGYGHNSVVLNIVFQIRHALKLMQLARERGGVVQPKRSAQQSYNTRLQRKFDGTVWKVGGCASWYYDKNGYNSVLYPRIAVAYWWATRWIRRWEYMFPRRHKS